MGFINSLAESLSKRTFPEVAKNIFKEEYDRADTFEIKYKKATEIFQDAKRNLISNGDSFAGIGPVSRKLSKQLRTGKFGMTEEEKDKNLMKSLGFDLDFGDDLDSSDANSSDGGSDFSSEDTSQSTTNNVFASPSMPPTGITQGDALINERLSLNAEAQNIQTANTTALLGRISAALTSIETIVNNQTIDYYRSALDHFKIQTDLATQWDKFIPLASIFFDNQKEEIEKRKAIEAKKMMAGGGNSLEDNLLDPERIMKNITESSVGSIVLDENSPIKGMVENAQQDPLGTVLAAGIGAGVSRLFDTQINFVKDKLSSFEYIIQNKLEDWSNSVPTGEESIMDSLKRSIGRTFKFDRRTDTGLSVGKYDQSAVDFDLQTKKAIVDVIPMYLSKILKAISGQEGHTVYDWETAKFKNTNEINAETKKSIDAISDGHFAGGFQGHLSRLGDDDDSKEIRRKVLEHALGPESHIPVNNLNFGTDALNARFDEFYSNLSAADKRGLNTTVRSHKFERINKLKDLESGMAHTGREAAYILGGDDIKLRAENSIRHPFRGGGGDLDPNSETNENRDQDGNPNPPPREPSTPFSRFWNKLEKFFNSSTLRFTEISNKASISIKDFFKNRILDPLKSTFNVEGDHTSKTFFNILRERFDHTMIPLKKFFNGGNEIKARNQTMWKTLTGAFERKILLPFKSKLLGVEDLKTLKKTSLLTSINTFLNDKILMPFKTSLLGSAERASNMGFFKTLFTAFDEKVLLPVKRYMVGNDRAQDMGFMKSLFTAFDEKVLFPVKRYMVGERRAEDMGFMKSLFTAFDEKVLFPLKAFMVGNDRAQDMGFFKSIYTKFDESILNPLKIKMVGEERAKEQSFFKAIATKFDESILFPLKKSLLGGNDIKAKRLNIFSAIQERLDRSVLFPIKKLLLGSDRSVKEVMKTSFFKSVTTAFTEKVIHPINQMLFGKDRRTNTFFSNIKETIDKTISPFFNRLLFGADKASKLGFMANLKAEGGKLWGSLWRGAKEKFFMPAINSVKELFGPVLKDFAVTIGGEIKHVFKSWLGSLSSVISKNFKEGMTKGITATAKGLFKTVFGEEIADILRKNVLNPLKDLTNTLTDKASKVMKFFLSIPANILRGVTNTVKLNRIKQGRGNYSPEEKARLLALQKDNKIFDFLHNIRDKTNETKIKSTSTAHGSSNESKTTRSNESTSKKSWFKNFFSRNESVEAGASTTVQPRSTTESISENVESAKATKREASEERIVRSSTRLADLVERLFERFTVNDRKDRVAHGAQNSSDKIHVTQEMANSSIVKSHHSLNAMLPILNSISTGTSNVLGFMNHNLTKLDARLENVVKLLRKQNGSNVEGVAGSNVNILRNPLQWFGKVMENTFGLGWKLLKTTAGSVFTVANKILEFPKKIAGTVVDLASSLTKGLGQLLSGTVEVVSKGAKALMTGLANSLEGIGAGLGKFAGSVVDTLGNLVSAAGSLVSGIAGPLAHATGSVINALAKGIVPLLEQGILAVNSFAKGLRVATEGVAKFAWHTLSFLSAGLGRAVGGFFGKNVGIHSAIGGSVGITNFGMLAKISKMSPIHTYVVGGQIATTVGKSRYRSRATSFDPTQIPKTEWKNPFKAKKDGEDKGFLGGLLGGMTALGAALRGVGGIASLAGVLIKSTMTLVGSIATNVAALWANTASQRGKIKDKVKEIFSRKKKNTPPNVPGSNTRLPGGARPLPTTMSRVPANSGVPGRGVFNTTSRGVAAASNSVGRAVPLLPNAATTLASRAPAVASTLPMAANALRTVSPATTLPSTAVRTVPPTNMRTITGITGEVSGTRALPAPSTVTTSVEPAKKGLFGKIGSAIKKRSANVAAERAGMTGLQKLGKVGKGLGMAGLIATGGSMASDLFFDKGTFGHDAMSSASAGAGWGATIGSFIPIIGTGVGALIGGALGLLKEAFPRMLSWVETKFESQIRSITETLINIPDKITDFASKLPQMITDFTASLPDKMTAFLDGVPSKIVNLFSGDPEEPLEVGEDGKIIEKKPSILGRMFVALGGAAWSIIKATPKIVVSLLEGMLKAGIGIAAGANTFIKQAIIGGLGSVGLLIGKTVEQGILYVRKSVPRWLGGLSDADYSTKMKELDETYDGKANSLTTITDNIKAENNETVKQLTGWSIAAKMGEGTGKTSITENKTNYDAAIKEAGGDNDKAEALFMQKSGKSKEDAHKEFALQKGEAAYRSSLPKAEPAKDSSSTSLSPKQTDEGIAAAYKNAGVGRKEGEKLLIAEAKAAGITSVNELAALLGATAHETGYYRVTSENLNYSAAGLRKNWPKRFPTDESAQRLAAGGPPAIANSIYGGRMGNNQAGDGWKYRGRGFLQLTGKSAYQQMKDTTGIDVVSNPDIVATNPKLAAKSAVNYWVHRTGLRAAAQRGDYNRVQRLINGGDIGIVDRMAKIKEYTSLINNNKLDLQGIEPAKSTNPAEFTSDTGNTSSGGDTSSGSTSSGGDAQNQQDDGSKEYDKFIGGIASLGDFSMFKTPQTENDKVPLASSNNDTRTTIEKAATTSAQINNLSMFGGSGGESHSSKTDSKHVVLDGSNSGASKAQTIVDNANKNTGKVVLKGATPVSNTHVSKESSKINNMENVNKYLLGGTGYVTLNNNVKDINSLDMFKTTNVQGNTKNYGVPGMKALPVPSLKNYTLGGDKTTNTTVGGNNVANNMENVNKYLLGGTGYVTLNNNVKDINSLDMFKTDNSSTRTNSINNLNSSDTSKKYTLFNGISDRSNNQLTARANSGEIKQPVTITSSNSNFSSNEISNNTKRFVSASKPVEKETVTNTSPEAEIVNELKAHTQYLKEIAGNTKFVEPTKTETNLFSGGNPSKIEPVKPVLAEREYYKELSGNIGNAPSYLLPSEGALKVSRAGNT